MTSLRLCEQVDEWYVLRTTQNGKYACCFLVPRLTLVERPSSLLWRALLLSVVSSFSVCEKVPCVTHMTRTPLGSRKHCSCPVITIHFITHGSGAVVLIRIAGRKSCGGSGRMVVVSGNTLVDGRPREHNGNSRNHRSRRSHVKLVQDENWYL